MNNYVDLDKEYDLFREKQIMGFDGAENSGVKAVWSNPCIETWLNAKIPNCQDSVYCCNIFSNEYKKRYLH